MFSSIYPTLYHNARAFTRDAISLPSLSSVPTGFVCSTKCSMGFGCRAIFFPIKLFSHTGATLLLVFVLNLTNFTFIAKMYIHCLAALRPTWSQLAARMSRLITVTTGDDLISHTAGRRMRARRG